MSPCRASLKSKEKVFLLMKRRKLGNFFLPIPITISYALQVVDMITITWLGWVCIFKSSHNLVIISSQLNWNGWVNERFYFSFLSGKRNPKNCIHCHIEKLIFSTAHRNIVALELTIMIISIIPSSKEFWWSEGNCLVSPLWNVCWQKSEQNS